MAESHYTRADLTAAGGLVEDIPEHVHRTSYYSKMQEALAAVELTKSK